MTISMYQASAPRFVNMLNNLTSILDKAQAHVDAKKLDAAVLTTYRLFPDMLPMTKQVQIACNTAKGVVARLAGVRSLTAGPAMWPSVGRMHLWPRSYWGGRPPALWTRCVKTPGAGRRGIRRGTSDPVKAGL